MRGLLVSPRRPRAGLGRWWVAPALAALVLIPLLPRLAQPWIEPALRSRLSQEAGRHGCTVDFSRLELGLLPLVRLREVRFAKPGSLSVEVERVDWGLRLLGRGLLGRSRIRLGALKAHFPKGVSIDAAPTSWDLESKPGTWWLRSRDFPLVLGRHEISHGQSFEIEAHGAGAGRLLSVFRDGVPALDLGSLTGRLVLAVTPVASTFVVHMESRSLRVASLSDDFAEGEPFGLPTDVEIALAGTWMTERGTVSVPRWQVRGAGASVSGGLQIQSLPNDPKVDLELAVERLDFAKLLEASGLEKPDAALGGDMGSAAFQARVTGRASDPASFSVSQHLDFRPPRRDLPSIDRLRGDFTYEAVGRTGERKLVRVSPESLDFIALGDVPPLFVRTLLIGEDAGFFSHGGFDLSEVPAAVLTNWKSGGAARGASTITQQLAKNLFLSRDKRVGRKLQELCLALLLEARLSKSRLLEIYLNVIEWGPGVYGLRPAARYYFGGEPGDLSPAQVAFLVALIPGPIKYQASMASGSLAPWFRPLVDNLLVKLRSVDALGEEEYQSALAEDLLFVPR